MDHPQTTHPSYSKNFQHLMILLFFFLPVSKELRVLKVYNLAIVYKPLFWLQFGSSIKICSQPWKWNSKSSNCKNFIQIYQVFIAWRVLVKLRWKLGKNSFQLEYRQFTVQQFLKLTATKKNLHVHCLKGTNKIKAKSQCFCFLSTCTLAFNGLVAFSNWPYDICNNKIKATISYSSCKI